MGGLGRPNHRGPKTHWPISEWEFREVQRRIREARVLPFGRTEAIRRLAAAYGVSPRTVYRWAHYRVESVTVGGYNALFTINGKCTPAQVTPWEKVA